LGKRKVFRVRGVSEIEERTHFAVGFDATQIVEATVVGFCSLFMIPPLFFFCCAYGTVMIYHYYGYLLIDTLSGFFYNCKLSPPTTVRGNAQYPSVILHFRSIASTTSMDHGIRLQLTMAVNRA
jgi:hypothetical protein